MEETGRAIPLTLKQRRQMERRRLRQASLMGQLAWWSSEDRRGEFPDSALRAEVKKLQKTIGRLSSLTPSAAWADDARRLPPAKGGEFPPTNDIGQPLMVRASGERCYYPPQYLTTSGHSWDVYLHALQTGSSEQLMEDGYMGGRVTIYTLNLRDRDRVHRMERRTAARRNRDRLITNVF